MSQDKVLLIGIGGTGSDIASRVYNSIPEKEQKKIVVHIFDTDTNDVERIGLKKGDITVTSSDLSVEKCLLKESIRNSNPQEWFPESESIKKMQFSVGAGQIRAVSRLAYMDAIDSGKLSTLEKKLQEFLQLDGENYSKGIRVMIVSSLAGGTGSGIFLQTALYLKDFFETRGKDVTIRGTFLLPDIFVKNNKVNGDNIISVRANGYACLKELDAIIRSTMGNESNSVNIQLAYKPGMDEEKVTKLPYDFAYLYDYENLEGKNLGSFEHYKNQVAKSVYLQLFSDIAGVAESDEINTMPQLAESQGRARFAGAGVSTLVYGYNEMLNYSTYRLVHETMGEKWLKIDKLYLYEMEEYETLKRQGIHKEKPQKHIRMNEIFDNEAKTGEPFFKNINRDLYIINKDNDLGPKKSTEFIKNLENYIKMEVESSKEIVKFKNYSMASGENMKGKSEDLRNEVESFEIHLNKYRKDVFNGIDGKKSSIVTNVLPVYLINDGDMNKFPHQVCWWILGENDKTPMNPLACRHFLYDLKAQMENKIRTLNEDTRDLLNNINRYDKDFGDGHSAREAMSSALEKSKGFLGIFNRGKSNFAEEYERKSRTQFKNISEYFEKKILLNVYEDLIFSIDDMIRNNEERFFQDLNELMAEFESKGDNLENTYESQTDVSKVYVLSSGEMKKKLYTEIVKNLNVENVLKDSYSEIFKEKYKDFISRRKGENFRENNLSKYKYGETIFESYKKYIESYNILNMSIIGAIKKEYSLQNNKNVSEKEYIENLIGNVKNRAKPFVQRQGNKQLTLWGVNNHVLKELSEEQQKMMFDEVSTVVKSDGFSPYEIIRYVTVHGLKAEDFSKFSSEKKDKGIAQGDYFQAYKQVIERLKRNPEAVTPHLDKRWHLPVYMPDINDEQVEIDKIAIDKSLINGILYEIFQNRNNDGKITWQFKDRNGGSKSIKVKNREIGGTYQNLIEGLGYNPNYVDEVNERVEEMGREDRNKYTHNFEKHKIVKLASEDSINFVDVLIKYVNQEVSSKKLEAKEKIMDLLNIFINSGARYFQEIYGENRRRIYGEIYSCYLMTILNESKEFAKSDKTVDFILDIKNKIKMNVEMILNDNDSSLEFDDIKNIDYKTLVEKIIEKN